MPYEKSMVLENREAMNLIAESARTVSRYLIETAKLLEGRQEGVSLAEVRDGLAEKFGRNQKSIQGMFITEAVLDTLTERGFATKDEQAKVWRAT